MPELHAQHRGLQLVQAAVPADALVEVGLAAAVVAEHSKNRIRLGVVGCDQTCISGGGEVLGRIERESAEVAPAAGAPSLVVRADALRAVLDQDEFLLLADRRNLVDRGALAEEMDRDDRLCPPGDAL